MSTLICSGIAAPSKVGSERSPARHPRGEDSSKFHDTSQLLRAMAGAASLFLHRHTGDAYRGGADQNSLDRRPCDRVYEAAFVIAGRRMCNVSSTVAVDLCQVGRGMSTMQADARETIQCQGPQRLESLPKQDNVSLLSRGHHPSLTHGCGASPRRSSGRNTFS